MWCRRCQEDVPGIPSPEDGRYCCPRCAVELTDASPAEPTADTVSDTISEEVPGAISAEGQTSEPFESAASAIPAPHYDQWELDERLRHVQRVLAANKGGPIPPPHNSQPAATAAATYSRFDLSHADPRAWHAPRAARARERRRKSAAEQRSPLGSLAWAALSLGTMAFVCGGVLLGWSLVTGRQELWNVGLPVALGGQLALVLGLVLQLDRLWNANRSASAKLDSVDVQLHQLKRSTAALNSTSHASPGSAFYAHLAAGAGPELLLGDLKSQLDLLAARLANRE